MFDEVDDRFELPFMIGLNLVLVGGALAYMRSATPRRRALVLLDALALAWMGSAVGTTVYWHGRRTGQMAMSLDWCTGARPAFIALFVLLAFLLAPALLGLVRRSGGGSRPLQTG
jgi:apolipoprotein N-acyltransferase